MTGSKEIHRKDFYNTQNSLPFIPFLKCRCERKDVRESTTLHSDNSPVKVQKVRMQRKTKILEYCVNLFRPLVGLGERIERWEISRDMSKGKE